MNSKFINYISIAIFAFFGGMARAGLNANFSYYGTFWGNVIGCFLLAFFTYFFIETKEFKGRTFINFSHDFIGAITTLSTFNLDVLKNMQANLPIEAVIYYFSSIIFGFVFAMLGMKIGKKVGQLVRKERNTR